QRLCGQLDQPAAARAGDADAPLGLTKRVFRRGSSSGTSLYLSGKVVPRSDRPHNAQVMTDDNAVRRAEVALLGGVEQCAGLLGQQSADLAPFPLDCCHTPLTPPPDSPARAGGFLQPSASSFF